MKSVCACARVLLPLLLQCAAARVHYEKQFKRATTAAIHSQTNDCHDADHNHNHSHNHNHQHPHRDTDGAVVHAVVKAVVDAMVDAVDVDLWAPNLQMLFRHKLEQFRHEKYKCIYTKIRKN